MLFTLLDSELCDVVGGDWAEASRSYPCSELFMYVQVDLRREGCNHRVSEASGWPRRQRDERGWLAKVEQESLIVARIAEIRLIAPNVVVATVSRGESKPCAHVV